ncbi:MAG: prepilin-type N-terminal cleavage/methylation domain-containing protein, partial [candidate division Zixibacteria bacterium]|nr:prepilin-type N-terminal cleavage/methylation domain-containing protein [candidate division Zixibacteria bacterium]
MTARLTSETGYSLIELIIVIVIVAIIASVAVKSLKGTNEVVRTEETKAELEQLAYAVAGNPAVLSGGARTDYGYVGDVGALPPNLDALVTNPGGYGTWDGPYVRDDFYVTA